MPAAGHARIALEQFDDRIREAAAKVLRQAGELSVGAMRSRFRPYDPAISQGMRSPYLHNRRGYLNRAIGFTVRDQRKDSVQLEAGVLWPDPRLQDIAHTQEFGRRIAVKRAQFMTIPVNQMLDARGVRRYQTVAEAKRDFSISKNVLSGPEHGVLLVRRRGTKDPWEVGWILRKKVKIDPRPFVRPTFIETQRFVTQELMPVIMAQAWKGAGA